MSETKLEMFQRLFPPRAEKVLDAIRVAGHCMKPHMEADTGLTDQFVRDVREAMDVFPPLGTDTLSVSLSGLEDDVADCDHKPDIEPDTDDTVTIRKSEFDRLKALELDRAKVAYGLSKIEKTNAGTHNQMMQGIALIKEGIGRKVKNDDDSERE
jgi:hypothetical protein